MTTTPADLLAAAKEITDGVHATPDREYSIMYRIINSSILLAKHILATVHPDEDEPVTVEKLIAIGAALCYSRMGGTNATWSSDTQNAHIVYWHKTKQLFLNGEVVMDDPTMKQVRQLLSALKVEVK